jgi:hypothetical protein
MAGRKDALSFGDRLQTGRRVARLRWGDAKLPPKQRGEDGERRTDVIRFVVVISRSLVFVMFDTCDRRPQSVLVSAAAGFRLHGVRSGGGIHLSDPTESGEAGHVSALAGIGSI